MKDLDPTARQLLELGKDAGEPDDAALARGRASLMRRVGGGAAAVLTAATVSTLATTAKAAPLPAAVVPTVVVVAPLMPAVPLLAAPLAVKLAAVAVAVVVAVGGVASTLPRPLPSPGLKGAPPAQTVERTPRPSELAQAPWRDVAPAIEAAVVPPPAVPRDLRAAGAPPPVSVDLRSPTVRRVAGAGAVPAASSLATDVASLRAAQAALVAGNPAAALDAVQRVQPDGPLADEREGVQVLAACAMGAPDARDRAEKFVLRRPQAPVALRVRAACLGDK